ncbi:MAG: HD domain-containing phosphohydrolase [Petrotogales bacterium]
MRSNEGKKSPKNDNKFVQNVFLIIVVSVLIVTAGVFFAWNEYSNVIEKIEEKLVKNVTFIKDANNEKLYRELSGKKSDFDKIEYKRLEEQFKLTKDIYKKYHDLYVLSKNENNEIFYFIDTGEEIKKGNLYENEVETLDKLFSGNVDAYVSSNKKETITTVFVSLFGNNEEFSYVIGVEVDYRDFLEPYRGRYVVPVVFTIILLVLLIISVYLVKWKNSLPEHKKDRRIPRYLESILLVIFGITLTLTISFISHYKQNQHRGDVFIDIAESQVKILTEELRHFRDYKIESIAHFFKSSEYVTFEEFTSYVTYLTYSETFSNWAWTPIVNKEERETFENEVKNEYSEEFKIWELDSEENKIHAEERETYYPMHFYNPFEGYEELLGYDLYSNNDIMKAIDQAVSSGLQTSTGLINIPFLSQPEKAMIVIRPVMNKNMHGQHGLVLALIDPDNLVRELTAFSRIGDSSVALGLYQINEEGNPIFFGTTVEKHKILDNIETEVTHYPDEVFNLVVPFFAFGEVYTVVAHPNTEFVEVYPANAGWIAFAVGILLTGYISTTVGFLSNRSHYLRKEVDNKTSELKDTLNQLRTTMEATITALASTVELRDPYTAGHQTKVTQLAVAIAKKLGLESEKIEGLRLAARVHDIGKIQVPAEILTTPRKLTDLEFTLIKSHPEAGYNLFKDLNFPWPVDEIIYQHHERLDGSGYPRELSDDEIMLEAKILGVADVVEAMSSHRPYRPSLGIDAALEEIEKNKGKLYDPEVVDACIELFKEDGFTFDEEEV